MALSRPARARGLKRDIVLRFPVTLSVAPRAGAWIETQFTGETFERRFVAPRAGAWIETRLCRYSDIVNTCRAPRGRVD